MNKVYLLVATNICRDIRSFNIVLSYKNQTFTQTKKRGFNMSDSFDKVLKIEKYWLCISYFSTNKSSYK